VTSNAVDLLAEAITDRLGPAARSVILHGSLAAGGFRPGRSDIDLLVVVDRPLGDEQADALEVLAGRADLGDAAGIDLHVVTAAVAGRPVREPALELYLGHDEVLRNVPADPDLAVELSMARAQGRALRGAPPASVVGPVPDRWVVDRGAYWLRTWRSLTGDDEHAAFMVLTACRIWRFAVEGTHSSKPAAGKWALTRDPSLTAVGEALRQYEQDPSVVVGAAGIAVVLETALAELTGRTRH
jgi:predicted nucleotidyltransferase